MFYLLADNTPVLACGIQPDYKMLDATKPFKAKIIAKIDTTNSGLYVPEAPETISYDPSSMRFLLLDDVFAPISIPNVNEALTRISEAFNLKA